MQKLLKPMMVDVRNIEFEDVKARFVLSHPQIVDNVAMVPVFSKQTVSITPRFMDEAMMNRDLIIREMGSWSNLEIQNRTDDVVVIPSGTHVVGGNQNRGIDRLEVMTPQKQRIVDAHCFEQGRSHGNKTVFEELSETPVDVVLQTMLTKGTGQSWDEISTYTRANGLSHGSALASFMKNTEEDRSKIVLNFETYRNQTGVISIFGNKFIMLESFPNHDVFNRYRSSIYRGKMASYVWKSMKNNKTSDMIMPNIASLRTEQLFDSMKEMFKSTTQIPTTDGYKVIHANSVKGGVSDVIINKENELVYMFSIIKL